MSKGIEWLKEEIEEEIKSWGGGNPDYFRGASDAYENVKDWLNQLDEPETVEETTHLLESVLKENKRLGKLLEEKHEEWLDLMDIINNRETETLSPKWVDDNSVYASSDGVTEEYVHVDDLKEMLVPKQEEVDQAYKDGYEKGKQHTFYKGYLEGLADKESEPETVADVIADFFKSLERLKEVMNMEVEELEE